MAGFSLAASSQIVEVRPVAYDRRRLFTMITEKLSANPRSQLRENRSGAWRGEAHD